MKFVCILTLGMMYIMPFSYAKDLKPIETWCKKLEAKFKEYNWPLDNCSNMPWKHVRNTHAGTPLLWQVFGDEQQLKKKQAPNSTLILCGVHGDEITPIKFCFDLMEHLKTESFEDKIVVVAPLVSPDSFFIPKPKRTNANGVDVNRNFPTRDWNKDARRLWKKNYKSDPRKNPGLKANSEQETLFQMNLIIRYKPNKIISVHAPLMLIDYDGPTLSAQSSISAKKLLEEMSEKASSYRVSNYPHFPGSLGNYAGKERHIPTYTLELPDTNPANSTKFWELFKDALTYAVNHRIQPTID